MFWGYSPALDFRYELESCNYSRPKSIKENVEDSERINILMIGASDARHILKTIAQSYRHQNKQRITFYVYEASLDLIARQIMLLTIALEPPEQLGLQEKTNLFLELYGNTLIRPTTANFITRKSAQFVHMVTDLEFQVRRMPLFRLDQLKYRERDYLENVFKFWQLPKSRFPITQYWDKRLRKHLGTRYDCRSGVFDWDYHMRLRSYGGEYITIHEYKNWRHTGVAFTWLETENTEPNLTLTTGAVQIGDKLCHHGYLGDIVTGPFIAYGLDCEDKNMLRLANGIQTKRTVDIAERNVMRIMHELLHKQPFIPTRSTDETSHQGIVITEITNTNIAMEESGDDSKESGDISKSAIIQRSKVTSKKEIYSAIPVDSGEVIFLPLSAITDFPKKEKYKNFFDIIFISQNMTQFITEELVNMVCEEGLLIVESKLFILDIRKDGLIEFSKNLNSTVSSCNCVPLREFDPLKDSFAIFQVKKKMSN